MGKCYWLLPKFKYQPGMDMSNFGVSPDKTSGRSLKEGFIQAAAGWKESLRFMFILHPNKGAVNPAKLLGNKGKELMQLLKS